MIFESENLKVTRLFLIRHGQSKKNAEGRFGGHSKTPLSRLGKKQARLTAKALLREKIDVIYSSDLPRAIQTAKPLAKLMNLEIQTTPDLRERNFGLLEGLTFEEVAELFPQDYEALVNRDFTHVATGGESYKQLFERASKKLEEILTKHKGKNIAIFAHVGVICFLSLYLLGAVNENSTHTAWISTSNCGICRFELYGRNNVRVIALNDTRHLQKITRKGFLKNPKKSFERAAEDREK
ncbi:MAG: histidine phosphatase family protein [Acidobacteria bacterium]|jgi:broad specificity phosphatase PhoE|nr:MAG: histidine phosphatase family protein [Acidobacteriota bacterium]GIU81991.1 MAG: phosphoglycerate mutase [Pyrinomonadaceae bacterium]